MAMHTAVRNQSNEMQARGFGLFHHFHEHRIGCQCAVLDGFVDAREILIDDTSSAQVKVPNLRIAHLPSGEPYIQPGRA